MTTATARNFKLYSGFVAGCWLLQALTIQATSPQITIDVVNLLEPLFPDSTPKLIETGKTFHTFYGDQLVLPLYLTSGLTDAVQIRYDIFDASGVKINPAAVAFSLFDSKVVHVEGNSNGLECTCPAGYLPTTVDNISYKCSAITSYQSSGLSPGKCPNDGYRARFSGRFSRIAPFDVLDPLFPMNTRSLPINMNLESNPDSRSRILVVRLGITTDQAILAPGNYYLHFKVYSNLQNSPQITVPFNVHNILMDASTGFPAIKSSLWFSVDPRDLVAKPDSLSSTATWGPQWWSDEHFSLIRVAATQLRDIGNNTVSVPMFTKDSNWVADGAGTKPTPLITYACEADAHWSFDTSKFRRWVDLMRSVGFIYFEGLPIAGKSGKVPGGVFDQPTQSKCLPADSSKWQSYFSQIFLPQYFQALANAIASYVDPSDPTYLLGNYYSQNLIDENDATDPSAVSAFKTIASSYQAAFKQKGLRVRTKATMYQNNLDNYDVIGTNPPDISINQAVGALLFYYPSSTEVSPLLVHSADPNWTSKIEFFYYETAYPDPSVGPNRNLDGLGVEMRALPWLATEKNLSGILYWAANVYRWPSQASSRRPADWTPFKYSIGPTPSGSVVPGFPPGSNWLFYPDSNGLNPTLRSLRYREGMVDNWLYRKINKAINAQGPYKTQLDAIMKSVLHPTTTQPSARRLNDYSLDPRSYDEAQEQMIILGEQLNIH